MSAPIMKYHILLLELFGNAAIGYMVYKETGIWTGLTTVVLLIILQLIFGMLAEVKNHLEKIAKLLQNQNKSNIETDMHTSLVFAKTPLTMDEKELVIRGLNGDEDSLTTFLSGRCMDKKVDFTDIPVTILMDITRNVSDVLNTDSEDFPDVIGDDDRIN